MSAKDALIAYGYLLDSDGKYRRPGKSTQVWQATVDGWLRFDPDGKGGEAQEVYMVSIAYQGTAGLDKTRNPEAFIWLWPETEVERIYAHAVEAQAAQLAEALARKAD